MIEKHKHCNLCGEAIPNNNFRCGICIKVDGKLIEIRKQAEEIACKDKKYLEEQKESDEMYDGCGDPRIFQLYVQKYMSKLIEKITNKKLKVSLFKRNNADWSEYFGFVYSH